MNFSFPHYSEICNSHRCIRAGRMKTDLTPQHTANLDLISSLEEGPPSCSVSVQHLTPLVPKSISTQITTLFENGVRAAENQRNHSGSLKNEPSRTAPGNVSSYLTFRISLFFKKSLVPQNKNQENPHVNGMTNQAHRTPTKRESLSWRHSGNCLVNWGWFMDYQKIAEKTKFTLWCFYSVSWPAVITLILSTWFSERNKWRIIVWAWDQALFLSSDASSFRDLH